MTGQHEIHELTVTHPRLDAAAAPVFKRELEDALPAGLSRLMIDLEPVDFIDSTGLGVLVSMLKQMGANGRIAVIGVNPSVARLFKITRLDSLFQLCGDADEARRALAA
jgi:anti-sigma B factor antagonist